MSSPSRNTIDRCRTPTPTRFALGRRRQIALLVGALFSLPALAGAGDALTPFVGITYAHDNNLLRVPDGHPGYENTRADSSRRAEAGVLFDKSYGRQHFLGQAKITKVAFSHFDQLDYDGKDYSATWRWQTVNHLEGSLGSSYSKVLAPYSDFVTSERNLRTHERHFFDGGWRLHPSWRIRAGASRSEFSYELLSQRFNNRTEDAYETGLDYLAKSGSTVGFQLRRVEGKYPFRRSVGSSVFDDSFEQDELKLRVLWRASGSTTVQFLGGHAKRKNAANALADSSGTNARLTADWAPRGKLRVNGALWREFAAVESALASYSLNTGASLGAAYTATAKVRLDGSLRYDKRDFNGLLASSNGLDLTDTTRYANLSASYAPVGNVQLSVSAFHDRRSGSPLFSYRGYRASGFAFNANAQF